MDPFSYVFLRCIFYVVLHDVYDVVVNHVGAKVADMMIVLR